jgi:hypothetical protein
LILFLFIYCLHTYETLLNLLELKNGSYEVKDSFLFYLILDEINYLKAYMKYLHLRTYIIFLKVFNTSAIFLPLSRLVKQASVVVKLVDEYDSPRNSSSDRTYSKDV